MRKLRTRPSTRICKSPLPCYFCCPTYRKALGPNTTENLVSSGESMLPSIPRAWRRAAEILRWRGPGYFLLLALREMLRPLLYWYAWNIYLTDLRQPLTEPYAKGKFEVRIFAGKSEEAIAREQLASP